MNLTYISAQGECDAIGGYLAEPITDLEQEFLYSMATIIEVGTNYLVYIFLNVTDESGPSF